MLEIKTYEEYCTEYLVHINYYVDNNFVGMGGIYIDDKDTLIVVGIEIWEEYRGKGYATKMMKEIVAFYKEQFSSIYPRLILRVFSNNIPALKAYIHSGFKAYEMEPPYGDKIVLKMELVA
jgi:RimJ/RimL family protein N-acetyltransferase